MLRSERQEHAAAIMMDAAREIEEARVRSYLHDYAGEHDMDDVAAILELAETADITVEWPEIAVQQPGGGR